jgi:hypothetical protein
MITQSNRYSPKVALTLVVGGREVALSRIGSNELIVRNISEPVPPSDARLVVTIDDESKTYDIYLPDGIPAAAERVAFI